MDIYNLKNNQFEKVNSFDKKDNSIILYQKKYLPAEFSKILYDSLLKLNYFQPLFYVRENLCKMPRMCCIMSNKDDESNIKIEWTDDVLFLKKSLEDFLGCEFNYVLINYYRDGDDYIAYHSDREAIGYKKNIIASVTVGVIRKFVFKNKYNSCKKEFLLDNGSLLVMIGDNVQKNWKHTVPKSKKIFGKRFNLTFRYD
jgi:hypothetical protein